MTYRQLDLGISGHEAMICIFLVPFERKHFKVCGNVGEYNTIDLVKDHPKKKQLFFFVPSLKCKERP